MNYTQLQQIIFFLHKIPYNKIIGYSYDTSNSCKDNPKCSPKHGYCVCGKIANVQISEIFNNYLIDSLSFLSNIDIPIILNLFSKYGFYDIQNWSAKITQGYNSEVISDICLNNDIKNKIIFNLNLLFSSSFYDEYPKGFS